MPLAADADYFAPSSSLYRVNVRVDDPDGLLAQLRGLGARVDERTESGDRAASG